MGADCRVDPRLARTARARAALSRSRGRAPRTRSGLLRRAPALTGRSRAAILPSQPAAAPGQPGPCSPGLQSRRDERATTAVLAPLSPRGPAPAATDHGPPLPSQNTASHSSARRREQRPPQPRRSGGDCAPGGGACKKLGGGRSAQAPPRPRPARPRSPSLGPCCAHQARAREAARESEPLGRARAQRPGRCLCRDSGRAASIARSPRRLRERGGPAGAKPVDKVSGV